MIRFKTARSWGAVLNEDIDKGDADLFLKHFEQIKQEGLNPYRWVKFDQDDGVTSDNNLGAKLRDLAGGSVEWAYVLEEIL